MTNYLVNWTKRIIGPPLPPTPLIFAKIIFLPLGWTYWNLVRGPIGKRFVDLSETGLWTYWKPVRGPIGNRFMDLSETGLWIYAETGSWGHSSLA